MFEYMHTVLNGLKAWVAGEVNKLLSKIDAVGAVASRASNTATKNKNDVAVLGNSLRRVEGAAETAQNTAETAQNTAETAQSTAETAQSTAENIVPAAMSQGVVGVKTITDIGNISGLRGGEKEYKAKGLNIKVNSTVTVTERDFGSASMIWDGYSAEAHFPTSGGPSVTLDYQVGTDTYTLGTNKPISMNIEKMEYTEVPVSKQGTVALPYLQFPHIFLYSNSGTDKLFKITVDDTGTLKATEVTK